jgi:hypothetical protein
MLDIPAALSLKTLHLATSMQMQIYVDRCRVTDTVVLSMYAADSSGRLFTTPIRDLLRATEAYERGRDFGDGKNRRLA